MTRDELTKRLQREFRDQINYTADDPLAPIDPLTYRNPEEDNCLHMAAIRGNEEAVRLLLDAGLDINSIGDMGNTPLHYAFNFKHLGVVRLLITRGARRDIANEFARKPGELP
jgi:ankyrin repeat protein